MAASLGGGILILAGGISHLFPGVPSKSPFVWAVIAGLIITTFVISSASGLMRGIRILSSINTYALFGMAIFILLFGPTVFILSFGLESFGIYITKFFQMNLFSDSTAGLQLDESGKPLKSWSQGWTIFYWAVWMAWTPVTACFLGRIAYGRTVREFMLVNFLLPSLFGAAWMAIFSGTALHLELFEQAGLSEYLKPDENGKQNLETVTIAMFQSFPLTKALVVFYVVSTFICFVTSADSNTTAMAAISSTGISPEQSEGGLWTKVAWGVTVGLVAWVMISFADINGIKIISTLGGFPAAFLILVIIAALFRVAINHEKYNLIDRES